MVVFDMSNIASMKSVKQWKEDACTNAQTDMKDQLIFLVGSKKDLVVSYFAFFNIGLHSFVSYERTIVMVRFNS
jgi:Ras family